MSYHSAICVAGPQPKNSNWMKSTRYSPLGRSSTLYPPELSVTSISKKLNEVSSAATQTLASGSPVPSSVTVPLIDPLTEPGSLMPCGSMMTSGSLRPCGGLSPASLTS